MKVLLFLIGVIIGVAICFWFSPKPPKPLNTAQLQVEAVGKSYLNPRTGDVLRWTDAQGRPLPVTFKYGSPCKEGDTTATCSVFVLGGFYKYTCPACLDPGVRVGSGGGGSMIAPGGGTIDTQGAQGAANTAEPPDPFVFCNASNGAASAQLINAHVNDQVQWFPSAQIANQNWHVTVAPNVCRQGTTFASQTPGQPTGVCTVLKSDTYTVEADACQIRKGTGQLTVLAGAVVP